MCDLLDQIVVCENEYLSIFFDTASPVLLLEGTSNEALALQMFRFLLKHFVKGQGAFQIQLHCSLRPTALWRPRPRAQRGAVFRAGVIYIRGPTPQQRAAAYQRVWRTGLRY